MSPVILLACIYTGFVSLVSIIDITPVLAPVLSLVLSPVLDPVLSLVYYLPKFLKYVKYNDREVDVVVETNNNELSST